MRVIETAGLLAFVSCAAPLRGQSDSTGLLSDRLTARVPGVQVQSRDGSAGAGSVVTIRGAAEPLTAARPLLIIDGVRVDNTQGKDNSAVADHPATSRFDDLDPAEIERVEILHGASAAALYGPGAGNGVILVTTRRGSNRLVYGGVMAEGGLTTTPQFEQPSYFSYGHTSGGTQVQCPTYARATGQCVLDSLTHFNPLLDDATTPFTTGNEQGFGAQLGETVGAQRAFITAHYRNQLGDLVMPNPDLRDYEAARGKPPSTYYRPNKTDRADISGQFAASFGHTIDAGVAGSYGGIHQRVPSMDSLLLNAALGPGNRSETNGWGNPAASPQTLFTGVATDRVKHSTVSAHVNWRPISNLTVHGLTASDLADETGQEIQSTTGILLIAHSRQATAKYSSDLGADLALRPAAWLASRTAFGIQYLETHLGSKSECVNLACPEVGGASVGDYTQSVYVDQAVTLVDRVTIDLGARWNHDWLHAYHLASTGIDPLLRARWTVLGADSTAHVSVHGAFGESREIPTVDAVGHLVLHAFPGCSLGFSPCVPPNRPRFVAERQREAEGGVSAGLADDRVTLDLTVFERRNVHVLNYGIVTTNNTGAFADSGAGITRDDGLEVSVGARPIATRVLMWDVTLSGFVNQNKVLRVWVPGSISPLLQLRAGYPVYGVWTTPYTYADANHDGVIEPSEVTLASFPRYAGPARPTREAALSTAVTLWRGGLRISALADYRGGYVLPDLATEYQDLAGTNRAINLPGASLAEQASAVAAAMAPVYTGVVQRVNAIRWRELAISAPLPVPRAQAVRLTVAARNIALWSNYHGPDPDADVTTGTTETLRLPQPRTWLVRLSADF
jgi:TonB-dependent SusC/RagA subfamily outer membrane receptor